MKRNELIYNVQVIPTKGVTRLGNPQYIIHGKSEFGGMFKGRTSPNANFAYNCESMNGMDCQVYYHGSPSGEYIVDHMEPADKSGIQTESKFRRKVNLTESDLHRIVKEAVRRVLREDVGYDSDQYTEIEEALSAVGDGISVSRFYSYGNNITIAVPNDICRNGCLQQVKDIMNDFGYEYYTAGGNDGYIMMDFKKIGM